MAGEEIPTHAALIALAIIISDLAKRADVPIKDLVDDIVARSIASKMLGDTSIENALNAFGGVIAGEAGKPTSNGTLTNLEAALNRSAVKTRPLHVVPMASEGTVPDEPTD